MEKEYRLRLKRKDLVMVTRCLGNHLLRELPDREWDEQLARLYNLFEWFIDALRGRRGRKREYLPHYSSMSIMDKEDILEYIRDGLERLSR